MSGRPVHYEVFSRRTPSSAWTLQLASEDRQQAVAAAEELMTQKHAAAVRVTKEILDPETGDYTSATILTKGNVDDKVRVRKAPESEAICTSPQDLYTAVAREKIGRLLEDWLRRQKVTAFELLHRPDLAQKLDDSGNELQHAVQKVSVAEAQESGQDLHELMRRWQGLAERSVKRLIQDGHKKLFPEIAKDPQCDFTAAAERLKDHPEKAYALGGAIALALKDDTTAGAKLHRLLAFARIATATPALAWTLAVIEAPVIELFAQKTTITDILGEEADFGSILAVITTMAAGSVVELVAQKDAGVARLMPSLDGLLGGYAELIAAHAMPQLERQLPRRLITDLKGPRRLRPDDPKGEIEMLRALALCLTAAGSDGQRDDIHEAFTERSRMLVSADFVDSLTRTSATPGEEIETLIWLGENVIGGANKRQAARWLAAALGALKLERVVRDTARPAPQRLAWLAQMQKRVNAAHLPEKDAEEVNARLGHLGGLVAGDVHLINNLVRSPLPVMQKLQVLLNIAVGLAAPLGPVSEAARGEIVKMMRNPELRDGLMSNPQALAALRPMMKAAGLAAEGGSRKQGWGFRAKSCKNTAKPVSEFTASQNIKLTHYFISSTQSG